MPGIMSGYQCHIRQLTQKEADLYKVDLTGVPIEECVAVYGEDLGECLAAVVHLRKDADMPLVWTMGSDAVMARSHLDVDDPKGTGKPLPNEFAFADAVATVLVSLFPHITALNEKES
jgi:hypothetical protein